MNGPFCITFEFRDGDAYAVDFEQYRQETKMKPNPDICPPHPGELLREDVLPAVGKSRAEIAHLLGISRKRLNDVLAERKPVTPELAVKVTKLFGGAPEVWSGLQNDYDIRHACRKVDVSAIPRAVAAE